MGKVRHAISLLPSRHLPLCTWYASLSFRAPSKRGLRARVPHTALPPPGGPLALALAAHPSDPASGTRQGTCYALYPSITVYVVEFYEEYTQR